jgi:predicted nucleic acid-binding protein
VTGWLIDTRLFKHLAPGEGGRKRTFRDWVSSSEEPIFLSMISVVDINASIQKVHDTPREPRRAALDAWLERIVAHYGDRIYPVDAGVAKLAGELMNRSQALGRWRLSDPLLAATARIHGHALVTERKSDFTTMKSGIELWDPFEQGLLGKRPESTG